MNYTRLFIQQSSMDWNGMTPTLLWIQQWSRTVLLIRYFLPPFKTRTRVLFIRSVESKTSRSLSQQAKRRLLTRSTHNLLSLSQISSIILWQVAYDHKQRIHSVNNGGTQQFKRETSLVQ